MKRIPITISPRAMIRPTEIPNQVTFSPMPASEESTWPRSGCLRCSDAPCMNFGADELRVPSMPELGSVVSYNTVCPTSAITLDDLGQPRIDPNNCIGCGLCVARCPVGALSLTSASETPVKLELLTEYVILGDSEALKFRADLAKKVVTVWPPVNAMERQVHHVRKKLLERGHQGAQTVNNLTRHLVRNTFVAMGARVALRNQGANSLSCELIAEDSNRTILVEISTTDDTLDAFRRLLSGAARALGRQGLKKSQIALMLVVPRLPNNRVDLYRLISDVHRYLGLTFFLVPLPALTFATLRGNVGVYDTFSRFEVNEDSNSVEHAIWELYQDAVSPEMGFIADK